MRKVLRTGFLTGRMRRRELSDRGYGVGERGGECGEKELTKKRRMGFGLGGFFRGSFACAPGGSAPPFIRDSFAGAFGGGWSLRCLMSG